MQNIVIFEGERAAHYDEAITRWIPAYDLFHAFISHHLQETFRPNEPLSILIAGCGTGKEIPEVSLSSHWSITGFDPSVEMIRQAEARYGKQPHVKLINGTIEAVKEKDFDVATLVLVLHFLSDDGPKQQLLAELCQRLKPTGQLLLVDIYHCEDFEEQLSRLQESLQGDVDPEMLEAGIKHIRDDIFHIPEDRLKQLIMEAGFSSLERVMTSYFYGGWIIRK
uniref:Methyltransferase domain-containing protein n=1 Tax=Roseihalotalea indica TaxID=2867963 RepID=A0AA49GSM5_9BACT|nr:methyltransferase domain-containing protein [Tunicatimonas sp. TK19036]